MSLEELNPELAQIISEAESVAKEIQHLTAVSNQINERLAFLTQYTVGIHEICHNLAVAANLVADDSIPFADRDETNEFLSEQEKKACLTRASELIAAGKKTELAKTCAAHNFKPTANKQLKALLEEETDPLKVRAFLIALNEIKIG